MSWKFRESVFFFLKKILNSFVDFVNVWLWKRCDCGFKEVIKVVLEI